MAAFRYDALSPTGSKVSGVLHADNARHARAQLRLQGLLPAAVVPVPSRNRAGQRWSRRIAAADLSVMTRQLATLLASGLTMEQSLNALIDDASQPFTREVLAAVKAEVSGGLSLAAALATYPGSFPEFYRALVSGGEESGALSTILHQLADYLDAAQALKQKTALALLYPALVGAVAISIVIGLLVYVVPQVVQVFQQSRQSLPFLTRAMIALSNFARVAGPYLVILVIAAAAGARYALRRDAVELRWHRMLLGIPGLGPLIRGVNTSRYASTLAILVSGGVPLLSALDACRRVMGNKVMANAIDRTALQVREGVSLARAMADSGEFPKMLVHLVASGEVTGKLDQMLQRSAQLELQTLERRLAVFLAVLEPVMILVMGAAVLLIVLAILLPIIEINQLVR